MSTTHAQTDWLAKAHSQFDPAVNMQVTTLKSNGYHTQLTDGKVVHPTTASMSYALECIHTGEPELIQRGQDVLRKLLTLQDTDPVSYTFGVWPWYLEEPLSAMKPPDLNWADFLGSSLARLLVRSRHVLAADLVADMAAALDRAAWRIFRRNMGPNYTNISILGASVTCLAGEILAEPRLTAYARRRLGRIIDHRLEHSGFNEYNSPGYFTVSMTACEDALHLLKDEQTKRDWERLRRLLWEDASQYYHVPTGQWAGPMSRSYSDPIQPNAAHYLSQRAGIKPSGHSKPGKLEPMPCPTDLLGRYQTVPDAPRQFSQRFQILPEGGQIVGTTWMDQQACLGSINHDSIWTQRRVLLGYWNANDAVAVLRLRFLRDGKDFASVCAHNAQNGPRVLSAVSLLMDCGNWHLHQDKRDNQTFDAQDFRLRYQLQCPGAQARQLGENLYELSAGDRRAVIHTTPSHFGPFQVTWQLGQEDDTVYLEGICYSGPSRAFDFRSMEDVAVTAGLELLSNDQSPSGPVESAAVDGKLQAAWPTNLSLQAPLRAVHRANFVSGFPFD